MLEKTCRPAPRSITLGRDYPRVAPKARLSPSAHPGWGPPEMSTRVPLVQADRRPWNTDAEGNVDTARRRLTQRLNAACRDGAAELLRQNRTTASVSSRLTAA